MEYYNDLLNLYYCVNDGLELKEWQIDMIKHLIEEKIGEYEQIMKEHIPEV